MNLDVPPPSILTTNTSLHSNALSHTNVWYCYHFVQFEFLSIFKLEPASYN